MRFCRIPRDLGGLGTTGEVAAATAGAMSSYTAGTHNPANAAAMGAAVVAGAASLAQLERSPAFLRGLGRGLAPSASFTHATLSVAAFQNAKTGADRFSASLGIISGVSGAIAGLMPPSPVKAGLTALSITAAAAQALVEAREPIEQGVMDAINNGTQFFNNFMYSGPSECQIDDIREQTQTASRFASPIILDLDGTGINTVGLSAGVNFDHAGDGFAERTGWVGSGDGLLVWDRNSNGVIDSGQELFGSETLLSNGMQAVNGFAALAELDTNGDGIIDANDPIFSELRVWVDANIDGITDEGELLTLEEAGVQSINLTYNNSNFIDENGNAHRQVGTFVTTSGEVRTATDVWFVKNTAYSVPTEWLDVPDDIADLPDARGYGKVHDLHQAMVRDVELKGLVERFVNATSSLERNSLITQIVYRWAGVHDVHPTSRTNRGWGNAIGDARRLEALEAFLGQSWSQRGWGSNPGKDAAGTLNQAYSQLESLVFAQLMAQSHLHDLFLDIHYGWDVSA